MALAKALPRQTPLVPVTEESLKQDTSSVAVQVIHYSYEMNEDRILGITGDPPDLQETRLVNGR